MLTLDHRYSHTIVGKKVAILGPLPPPFGGVSVHCARVTTKFEQQNNNVFHFNTTAEYRYRFFLLYRALLTLFLLRHRPHIVYYHTSYLANALAEMQLLAFVKKVCGYSFILVEHDCRFMYKVSEQYKKRLNRIMPYVDKQVFIGNITFKSFTDVQIILPQKYSIEGAFLPPSLSHEQAILATYPPELFDFIRQHTKLIIANAFQLSQVGGKDLYGFDLCIELIEAAIKKEISAGMVFVMAQIGDVVYFEKCWQKIVASGIERNIFILVGQKELWPLLKQAQLFVRPTLSDGASVSVSEALYFNVPVVASNVCARPVGTMLFKAGNTQDFIYKALPLLQKKEVDEKAYCERNNMHAKSIT